MSSINLEDEDRLLTRKQLAEYLGLSLSAIEKRHRLGQPMPAITRIGARSLRYRLGDVKVWLAAGREVPAWELRERPPGRGA